MGIENVGDRYTHANFEHHNRQAEPEENDFRDGRRDAGRTSGDRGADGTQRGDGYRTGGNNPASQGDRGPQETGGRDNSARPGGNYGNGNYDNGAMNTGGRAPAGLFDVAPRIIHQLGNSLFSTANAMQSLLRSGDGGPVQRNGAGTPGAHVPPHAHPSQAPQARAEARLHAPGMQQAPGMPASTGMGATQAMLAAQAGTPNALAAAGSLAAGTTTGAGMAATTASAMAQQAGMPQRTLAGAHPLAAQQGARAVADAAMLARPDAANLAAARAAMAAAATAPAPPNPTLPTMINAPALPLGNPQALAAAGVTVATVPTMPADARGVVLPTHDAATSQRAESTLNPAGHTLEGGQRRSLRNRLTGSMPEGRLARLLWAMGALGHTAEGREPGAERTIQRVMQWLFWILALVAYGCLAAAIVVFMGSDGRLMDSIADRNATAGLAMCGLGAGVVAWGLARWISRRR